MICSFENDEMMTTMPLKASNGEIFSISFLSDIVSFGEILYEGGDDAGRVSKWRWDLRWTLCRLGWTAGKAAAE